MDFLEVRLEASQNHLEALRALYSGSLGMNIEVPAEDNFLALEVGDAKLCFAAAPPSYEPFYHFALLLPGDRFHAAHEWLSRHRELLHDPDTGATVFDFDNWNALACYLLDPAGNIVEFIAHKGIAEAGTQGDFSASEIVGFSELGLVTKDKAAAASLLERHAALPLFDGEVDEPGRLAFIGERGRCLILSPRGRGWLPTGRPAEIHPLEVILAATCDAVVDVPGSGQRVNTISSSTRRSRDASGTQTGSANSSARCSPDHPTGQTPQRHGASEAGHLCGGTTTP